MGVPRRRAVVRTSPRKIGGVVAVGWARTGTIAGDDEDGNPAQLLIFISLRLILVRGGTERCSFTCGSKVRSGAVVCGSTAARLNEQTRLLAASPDRQRVGRRDGRCETGEVLRAPRPTRCRPTPP